MSDQCADGHQDGAETDLDCGGSCTTCANGLMCALDSDCMSGACDAMSTTCVADQCADHRTDGAETDVDCGGGTCPACASGQACNIGTDCSSTMCTSHVCN